MEGEKKEGFTLTVSFRGRLMEVNAEASSLVGDVGNKILELTAVAPYTLRLLIPQGHHQPAKFIHPLSQEFSNLSLQQVGISEARIIKMMGSTNEELQSVLQPSARAAENRIIGFEEEDKRARQRSRDGSSSASISADRLSLFGSYRALELPGIELNPPPSKALELLHRLAADRGVIAVMKKHGWKVGIMSELAPEGYVGISPKCVLGLNKNHGEEISLRLRTDDLKGFRNYDSIKKTLMHELAHMVFGEHDENFHRLDKQLNKEVVELDWTKGTRHTLSLAGNFAESVDENSSGSNQMSQGIKLGGNLDAAGTRSARSAAAAAALARLSHHPESTIMENLSNNMENSSVESDAMITQQNLSPLSNEDRKSIKLDSEDAYTMALDEKDERITDAMTLHGEILKLQEQASPAEVGTVLQTLSTIIGNALKHPDEAKFRRLRMKNPSFQQRVARFQAALEVLRLAGFSAAVCVIDGVEEECLILNHNNAGLLSLANASIQTFLN